MPLRLSTPLMVTVLVFTGPGLAQTTQPALISEVLDEAAAGIDPILRSALADKPSPYIVKAHDVGEPTDFHKDIPWHLLDKEKDPRFDLASVSGLGLGEVTLLNTNSGIVFSLGLAPDRPGMRSLKLRYVDHLINLAVRRVETGPLTADVLLLPVSSDTLLAVTTVVNTGSTDVDVLFTPICSELSNDERPGNRFGYGIHSTTGRLIRQENLDNQNALVSEFEEWDQTQDAKIGRMLATLMSSFPAAEVWPVEVPKGIEVQLAVRRIKIAAGRFETVLFALNLHRYAARAFTTNDIQLYPQETPEQAQQYGLSTARRALSTDWPALVRESYRWYERMPVFELAAKHWVRDMYSAMELPRGNTWSAQELLPQPWYTFCRVHGHNPYGWWSYGMHGHEHLSTFTMNLTEPTLSQSWLRGHFQVQRPDGFIQYGVNLRKKSERDPEELATAPLLMWEAWNAYLWSGDRAFLEEAYRAGVKYVAWWRSEARTRKMDRQHAGPTPHRRDAGATPDRRDAGATPLLPLQHWKDYIETVRDDRDLATWVATDKAERQEALDLNCYLLSEERTLSAMARELGKADEAENWDKDAQRRAEFMRAKLWHEEDRVFYGRDLVGDRWARVMDISTFFPLWSGLATAEQARQIVARLRDPTAFATDFPVATLAVRHMPEKKRGYHHWRGSNWVEMTWLVILGLKRYGYHDEAARIAEINFTMVSHTLEDTGHFREFYSSLTGEPTDLTDYIWTCLPAAMVVDTFLGIRPTAEGLEVMPALPAGWQEISIRNLHVRDRRVSVSVRRVQGGDTSVKLDGMPVAVHQGRGAIIPWSQVTPEVKIAIHQSSGAPSQRVP